MDYIPHSDDIRYARQLADEMDVFEDERDEFIEVLEATQEQVDLFACDSTIEFGERVCGIVPNARQRKAGEPWYDPLQKQIWDSVDAHPNTIVFSGNGIGKTRGLGLEALRRFFCGYAIVTTAPVKRQVENLWSEIRTLKAMSEGRGIVLPGRWSPRAHHVELSPKWTLSGYTARVASGEQLATAFSGKHYDRMMAIMDELVGVPEPIWLSLGTLLVGAYDKYLGAGNPTQPTSYAAQAAKMTDPESGRPLYNVLHLSSEDHMNVRRGDSELIPGATSKKFIALQLAKGGHRDSAIYRYSVRGLFPNQAEDALIKSEWIEAAKLRGEERWQDAKNAKNAKKAMIKYHPRFEVDHRGVSLGLDVAGEGRDLTVLTACESSKLFFPRLVDKFGAPLPCWHRGRDHLAAVDLMIAAIKQIPRVLSVAIDDTGLGAAVSAELWKRSEKEFPEVPIYITKGAMASPYEYRQKCSVLRINFGMAPVGEDAETFGCIKDSLWWAFATALRLDKLHLPSETEHREAGFPEKHDGYAQILAPVMWNDSRKMHILDKRSAFGGKGKEVSKYLPTISPDIGHSWLLSWWAYKQLADRIAAPETPVEIAQVQKDAVVEAASPKPHGTGSGLRPFQRRAR